MKLGIMGTGKIVQEALPLLADLHLEKCYLAARESSKTRAAALCAQYELDGFFLDTDALLAADIDTVYVALPNRLHFEFAKKALEAGKHVILEKPITVTLEELLILEELAEKKQLVLLEAMSTHHLPAFHKIKELLPALGPIRLINFQFCQYSSRYDDFLKGAIAPAFDPACMGGALLDINVYNLHAILGLFGAPQAAAYAPVMQRGIDTSGIVTLDYGTFQAVALGAKDCFCPTASTIIGEKGVITIGAPANKLDSFVISIRNGETETFAYKQNRHRLSYELEEFDRIIRERDFAAAKSLLSISKAATTLLEQLRPY